MIEDYHVYKVTCDYCGEDITVESTRIDIQEHTKELKYHERILFMFQGDESFCDPECLIKYVHDELR